MYFFFLLDIGRNNLKVKFYLNIIFGVYLYDIIYIYVILKIN